MRHTILSGALAAAIAVGAAAQDERTEGPMDDGPRNDAASLRLDTTGSYTFESDLDGAGDVSVWRARVALGYDVPVFERSTLTLGFDYGRSEYDFGGATGLAPGGDVIGGANNYGLSARYLHPLNETWSFLGGASVEVGAEDGADYGEAVTFGGLVGVGWRASEDLTLTFGVQGSDRLEDDARIYPIVGIEWRIDETLRLTTGRVGAVLADRDGAGIGLEATLREGLRLLVGGEFIGREFRLDEDGAIPDGVLEEDRVIVGAALTYAPERNVEASLGVGAAVWSNFETRDASGTSIGDEDADPTPIVAARLRVLF